jgi:threonine/homoserine/homoserine lactone efflux protein
MTAAEFVIIVVLLLWCFLSCLILFGSRIKQYFVRRMNNEWMERGSSPWHVTLVWRIVRPFVGRA